MSTDVIAGGAAADGHTGTVFDIGYRSYDGVREGRGRGRLAIFKDGVRTALGIGRGVKAKVLPWFFIALLSFIAMVMALIAGAVERLGGPGAAEQMNLPSHADFYGIAAILVFVFAALVAPELLCRDRREGTIHLYLVRPISPLDYVGSRYAAFLAVTLAAIWLPQLILLFGLSMDDPSPAQYLMDNWLDVPRFLLAGFVMATFTTGLALLTASFTTRRAYAAVFLVGLFIISTPFTAGLASQMDGAAGQWISMFNLANIPLHVNDIIFGEITELTEDAPARTLPAAILVAWWFLWTAGPAAALAWRYNRMSR